MAKKIVTTLVDDLDGTELGDKGHTVEFGWLGQSYEIDLSDTNAETMRNALGMYVEHARKAGRPAPAGRRTGGPRTATDRSETKEARAWLIEHGHMKEDSRGRIPADMWELYRNRGQMDLTAEAEKPARTRRGNSKSAEKASSEVETPEAVAV